MATTTFNAIVLVGGMCAGKSTLARAIATSPALRERCEVAARVSTRSARVGDDNDGIISVEWNDFQRRVARADFVLSWERPVSDGTVIGYGCMRPRPGRIPILMAGHGVYSNSHSVRPVGTLSNALLLGVFAPLGVRAERLGRRSPDLLALGDERIAALMAHDDEAMFDHVDLTVDNYDSGESSAM